MPQFKYKAIDAGGNETVSSLEAASETDLISQLSAKNLTVVDLKVVQSDLGSKEDLDEGADLGDKFGSLTSRIPMAIVLSFYEQLSFLLVSGIPLHLCIRMTVENLKHQELISVLKRILFDLSEGSLLSASMRRFPKVFPTLHTQIIHIGEKTGTLDKALLQLVDLTKERLDIERQALNAASYPAFLMLLSSSLCIGMIAFVFPKFQDIFSSFGGKLPALTTFLMDLSHWMNENSFTFLAGTVAVVGGTLFFLFSNTLSEMREKLMLSTPILKDVFISMFVSQMSKTMGSTLKSGIPLMESLIIVRRTLPEGVRRDFLDTCIHAVREGEPLSLAIQRAELVPELVWQLVSVGEKTGNMATIMDNIFFFYKKKYQEMLDRVMGVLKPALMFGSAVVISAMAAALFIPLFKMGSNIKRGD